MKPQTIKWSVLIFEILLMIVVFVELVIAHHEVSTLQQHKPVLLASGIDQGIIVHIPESQTNVDPGMVMQIPNSNVDPGIVVSGN